VTLFAVAETALTQVSARALPAAFRTIPLIVGRLAAAFPLPTALRRAAARTAPAPAGTIVTGRSQVGCPAATETLAAASASIDPP
jgi:hypothetical protein